MPMKYTEKGPGIFQSTYVKTEVKEKLPSEVIQKTNGDLELEQKPYCIPEARLLSNQLK